MNIKDKSIWWKHHETFLVTNSLLAKIDGLPRESQIGLCFVFSEILYRQLQAKHRTFYVEKLARELQTRFKNYQALIQMLFDFQELQPRPMGVREKRNYKPSVKDASGKVISPGYARSYRINPDSLNTGVIWVEFKRKRAVRTDMQVDRSTMNDELGSFIKKNLQDLYIPETIPAPVDPALRMKGERLIPKVNAGVWNVRARTECGRSFNTPINLPKFLRGWLAHKDGSRIANCDWKSCHPFLLIAICAESERARYAECLSQDIYATIASARGTTREDIKAQFMFYLNAGGQCKGMCKDVLSWMTATFPLLTAEVQAQGKMMAGVLQKRESDIVIELAGWACKNGVWFVNQHDGWLCRWDDAGKVERAFKDIVLGRVGYEPSVKVEDISVLRTQPPRNYHSKTVEYQTSYSSNLSSIFSLATPKNFKTYVYHGYLGKTKAVKAIGCVKKARSVVAFVSNASPEPLFGAIEGQDTLDNIATPNNFGNIATPNSLEDEFAAEARRAIEVYKQARPVTSL